jgi:hypothetical protein
MSEPTDTPSSIDSIREALIAAATSETAEEADEGQESAPEAEAVAATGESSAAATAAESPADPVEPPDEPKEPETRAYRRLLAGEAKLRQERAAWEAEKAKLDAEIAEYRIVKTRADRDPIAFLRGIGLPQAKLVELAREIQLNDLGDLAPADARATLAAKRAETIAREAEERIAAAQKAAEEKAAQAAQEREAQQFVVQYQANIEKFVDSGLGDYPHLATMATKGKPVAAALYQTAIEMASQRDPMSPAPTPAEVAAQLNTQLAEFLSAVAPAPEPTPPAPVVDPTESTPAKPVLRNTSTNVQPGPLPEREPKSYEELRENIRQKVFASYGLTQR